MRQLQQLATVTFELDAAAEQPTPVAHDRGRPLGERVAVQIGHAGFPGSCHADHLYNSNNYRLMIDRLRDTRDAFDSVAADYDGDRGNNLLIQQMRDEMWRWLDATFPPRARLIDIGCGTGLDAVRMAQQ